MSTIGSSYQINGVIDTNQSVYQNIQKLANASGCWFTFDIHEGKWSVIINKTGTSVASFDDTNIIGSINVSGKGIRELYNKVQVEFPHEDILDEKDYTEFAIDTADLYPNEVENTLTFSSELVSKPEHAQRLGLLELKQSRVDKVINFRTDFTKLGLKAGDLIDITSSMYGYTAKLFRITQLTEEDGDDNTIQLSITALEYDANVYDYSDVFRDVRERANGIIVKTINTAVAQEEDKSMSSQLARMLAASFVTGLINSAFSRNPSTGVLTQTVGNTTTGQAAQDAFSSANRAAVLKSVKIPSVTITGPTDICEGETLSLTVALADPECACQIDTSTYQAPYTITGITAADTSFPLTGNVSLGTVNIPITTDALSESETLTFTVNGVSKVVTLHDSKTYTIAITASADNVTEGGTRVLNIATTGIANGTVIPYTITGTGTGKVSSSLTGNVTINSNAATFSLVTTSSAAYDGNLPVVFALTTTSLGGDGHFCEGPMGNAKYTVTIKDTYQYASECGQVSVPLVWCEEYDSSGRLINLVPDSHILLRTASAGSASTTTVPLTVSVAPGTPSTVTILTTATVDTTTNRPGITADVITSFNTVAVNAPVTGTVTTVKGVTVS